MTFDSMIDDALCIDVDAEYALMNDPSFGSGSTLDAAEDFDYAEVEA